jgi:hypothetical protein
MSPCTKSSRSDPATPAMWMCEWLALASPGFPASPPHDKPYHWTARWANLKLVMRNPTSRVPLTERRTPSMTEMTFRVWSSLRWPFSFVQPQLPRNRDQPRDHSFFNPTLGEQSLLLDGLLVLITLMAYYVPLSRSLEPGPQRKNGRNQYHGNVSTVTRGCASLGVHAVPALWSTQFTCGLGNTASFGDRRCSGQRQRPGRSASYRIRCKCSISILPYAAFGMH